jgi:hypothetical protein
VHFIPMNLKERKSIKKAVILGFFEFKILVHLPCRNKLRVINEYTKKLKLENNKEWLLYLLAKHRFCDSKRAIISSS